LVEKVGFGDGYLWFRSEDTSIRYDKEEDTFRAYQGMPEGVEFEKIYSHWGERVNDRWGLRDLFYSLNLDFRGLQDEIGPLGKISMLVDKESLWLGGGIGLWRYSNGEDSLRIVIAMGLDRLGITQIAG
jgi:ligand-binding sensor domain-containing protein